MVKLEKSRIWLPVLALLAAAFLWKCMDANGPDKSVTLNLKLADSLSIQAGIYDSVRIDVYDKADQLYKAAIFHGPYDIVAHKDSLSRLYLGINPPFPLKVKITATKRNGNALIISFQVNENVSGTPDYILVTNPIPIDPKVDTSDTSKLPIDTLPKIIPPASVVIDTKSPLVLALGGASVALQARVLPDSANPTLEWLSDNSTIAAIVNGNTVSPVSLGTTTLIARSKEDPSKFKTMVVEVQAAPIFPKTVAITNRRPLKISIGPATIAMEAKVEPLGASPELTWISSDTTIARMTLNQLKGVKAGTAYITAQSVADPAIKDTITLEVQVEAIAPASLEIGNASPLVLIIGNPDTELKASVLPSGADPTVVWASTDIAIADIVNGAYAKGIKAGETQFTATSSANTALKKTLVVRVQNAVIKPKSITITVPDPMNLAIGGADGSLAAKIDPADAKQEVIWESKDTSIVKITSVNQAKPGKAGITKVIVKSKEDPTLADTMTVEVTVPVKVDGISITPKTLKLYTGGKSAKVTVALIGNDPGAKYSISSSDPKIVSVSADDSVKGLAAGKATLRAVPLGLSSIVDSCQVEVITDAPVVTVTDNSPIAYNEEAVFNVSTKQDYGTIEEILADMDGNGAYEVNALKKDTAIFKKKYSANTTVNFEVRDSEGNKTRVTRNLVVQPPGAPIVKITVPTTPEVTLKVKSYTFTFSVNDPALGTTVTKDSTVSNLAEGNNLITVSRTNAGGTGKATLTINVDTTPPDKPTFKALTSPTSDNTPTWSWNAAAGAIKYQVKLNNTDLSTGTTDVTGTSYTPAAALSDGDHALSIRALDELGNASAVTTSSMVTVKTTKPGTPKSAASPTTPTNANSLTWKWTSGGNGNKKYRVLLNDVEQAENTTETFTLSPTSNGSYVVKVYEKDDLNQESASPLTFGAVVVDKTAPIISLTGYPDGQTVTNTSTNKITIAGTLSDGGSSGLATCTYTLAGGTTKASTSLGITGTINTGVLTLGNDATTTMTVTATDKANNSSTYVAKIQIAVPKPTIKFIETAAEPTPKDGYVFSANKKIRVFYSINGGPTIAEDLTIAEPVDRDVTTKFVFTKAASEEAGSPSITRTFYRAHRSVLFFTPTGAGSTCDSWENACQIESIKNYSDNSAWLQAGKYDIGDITLSIPSLISVYGGVAQYGNNARDLSISTQSVLFSDNVHYAPGIQINGSVFLKNITVEGYFGDAAMYFEGGSSILKNCIFQKFVPGVPYVGVAVGMNSTTVEFQNTIFTQTEQWGYSVYRTGYGQAIFKDCKFSGGYDVESYDSDDEARLQLKFYNTTISSGEGAVRSLDISCGLPGATYGATCSP